MPTPMATQAHTFIPVNGSVPRALAEVPVPLALAEPVEPLVRVDEDWESEELPVEDEEPAPLLEVEPELEPEPELEDEGIRWVASSCCCRSAGRRTAGPPRRCSCPGPGP